MRWDCLQIYNSRDSRSNDSLRFLSRRLDVVLISAAQRPKGLTSSRLVCLLMFDTLKLTILKHSLTSSLWKWVPAWFAAFLCRGSPPYICFIISNWHRRQMVLILTGWAPWCGSCGSCGWYTFGYYSLFLITADVKILNIWSVWSPSPSTPI